MARVALFQIDVGDGESSQTRFERVLEAIADQKGKCDIAILPELWLDGAFNIERAKNNAQSITGDFVTAISLAAKQAGIWLHAGSFAEKDKNEIFNTSILINSHGLIEQVYRKIHLFGFDEYEAREFTAGSKVIVAANSPLGTVGLSTCYDLRFPGLFRASVDQDVQTFLITSGWPEARIAHWRILLQARAIENQCWVVACNEVGINGDVILGGNSMVVSPLGDIVLEAGTQEGIFYADIDLSLVEETRSSFPVLRDRVLD